MQWLLYPLIKMNRPHHFEWSCFLFLFSRGISYYDYVRKNTKQEKKNDNNNSNSSFLAQKSWKVLVFIHIFFLFSSPERTGNQRYFSYVMQVVEPGETMQEFCHLTVQRVRNDQNARTTFACLCELFIMFLLLGCTLHCIIYRQSHSCSR